MKVTKSAVGTAVVWCIFCNCFSTDIYKDVIFVDAQKLEANEIKGPTMYIIYIGKLPLIVTFLYLYVKHHHLPVY